MRKGLIIILVFVAVFLNAQAPKKFYTRFGGYGHDIGYGVLQTLNGQYAVTGSTGSFGNGNTDAFLALVDSMGWVRWEKSYGGFNNDVGRSIIQLADSGFVIAGYTNSFGGGGYDVLVVRTDKNGTLIWQKAFGGLDWDFGYCVKTCPTGDSLVVAGSTYSYGYGKMDGYILKLDLNGNLQWQKTYGGAEDDEFRSFVYTTYDNKYVFAGTTRSMGDVNGDAWLVKTDLAGDSTFSLKYGNNYKQFLNDITENPITKNFHVCGGYDQTGLDSSSALIYIIDQVGNNLANFIHTYHEQNDEQYLCNTYFRNSEFYYIRKSINTSTDHREEPMVSLFDNNTYEASTKYGSLDNDQLYDISQTKNKGAICVGYTTGWGADLSDVFLLKLDSTSLLGAPSVIGIHENEKVEDNYSVYPTITTNDLTIYNGTNYYKGKIYVYDSFGRNLMQKDCIEKRTVINLSDLSAGIYFITITNTTYSNTYKVMKID